MTADPKLSPGHPKRRRLSHSPNLHEPMPQKGKPLSSSSPWVDEFDDCDSLFPPLAPVPGLPRYRSRPGNAAEAQAAAAPRNSPAGGVSPAGPSSRQAASPQASPISGQARH